MEVCNIYTQLCYTAYMHVLNMIKEALVAQRGKLLLSPNYKEGINKKNFINCILLTHIGERKRSSTVFQGDKDIDRGLQVPEWSNTVILSADRSQG